MSSPTTSRPSRRTLALVGAGVAALLVAGGVWLAVGGTDDPSPAAEASTSAPSRPTSPVSMPSTSPPPATPEATGSSEDQAEPPASLDAVALDGEASVDQVTARLTDVSVVEATGQGPGNVSGPALRITVELTNAGSADLALSGVDITADSGEARDPASPVDDGQTRGLAGTVPPGASASGTYLFSLPAGASTATVSVAYQAGAPIMVFSGSIG